MANKITLRCIVCGCTDDRACEGGCTWVIREPVAICSECAPGVRLKRALRFLAVHIETSRLISRGREENIRQLRAELESRNARIGREYRKRRESN